MEHPIKMDDLGVPSFLETPICYWWGPLSEIAGRSAFLGLILDLRHEPMLGKNVKHIPTRVSMKVSN